MSPFRFGRHLPVLVALLALTGCGTVDRLSNVGKPPPLTPIVNPQSEHGYQPVSLPMPRPMPEYQSQNSLWRAGARSFFKDQRANTVGDILTVVIAINDTATIENESRRSRANEEGAALGGFFGLEGQLQQFLPDEVVADNLVDFDSDSNHQGSGSITRGEQIELQVAALISDVLPNGNMVIHGRQEVRVNFEVRELLITGIIRPQDIEANNTISYEKIAEARISYGGRGQITDVQQPRYGQQVYDIIFPF